MADRRSIQFSCRSLIGFVTLGCVTLGATFAFAPRSGNIPDFIISVLGTILAVETTLALYAACDPWLGCPSALAEEQSATAGELYRTDLITRIFAILLGIFFLLVGGFAAAILVEDNLTMDTGGASGAEWRLGLPFIAATMIASFARGTSLFGFLALLCGVRLGRDFAKHFGLCGGSFLAFLLWGPTHDFGKHWAGENHGMWKAYGNFVSGIAGLVLLSVCGWLAWWFVGREFSFGRRARRRSGRLFLLGLFTGGGAAMTPAAQWLPFGESPLCLYVGAMIGSSLGAVLGLLAGASAKEP